MNIIEIIEHLKNTCADNTKLGVLDSVYTSISETHHTENYHSDILAYYLKDVTFRNSFIDAVNSILESTGKAKIERAFYSHCDIRREYGRIDIAIISKKSPRAIVIENKSNRANDQPRQLIDYLLFLRGEKMHVDCMVYLNHSVLKEPEYNGYSDADVVDVKSHLAVMQLVGQSGLVDLVLTPIIERATDTRIIGLCVEYKAFLNKIAYNKMAMSEMSEFVDKLRQPGVHRDLKKCLDLYQGVPEYLARYFKDYLEQYSKKYKVWLYRPHVLVADNIERNGKTFAIDMVFERGGVSCSIFNRNGCLDDVLRLQSEVGPAFPFLEVSGSRLCCRIEDFLDLEYVKQELLKYLEAIPVKLS